MLVESKAGRFRVRLASSHKDISDAKRLMTDIAIERNWQADSVIEGYDDCAYYWIACTETDQVIGTVKLIWGDPLLFPIKKPANCYEEAWPELLIAEPAGLVGEVAFVALEREYRGDRLLLLSLYSKMYWDIKNRGIAFIYAILDPIIHVLYRRMGIKFVELDRDSGGGRKVYWGEETFPARLDLTAMVEDVRLTRPMVWSVIKSFADTSIED